MESLEVLIFYNKIKLYIINNNSFNNKLIFIILINKYKKKKNILTAIAILGFMVFLFLFTLYNVGVFDRQI